MQWFYKKKFDFIAFCSKNPNWWTIYPNLSGLFSWKKPIKFPWTTKDGRTKNGGKKGNAWMFILKTCLFRSDSYNLRHLWNQWAIWLKSANKTACNKKNVSLSSQKGLTPTNKIMKNKLLQIYPHGLYR